MEDLNNFSNAVNASASKGELIMAIYELGVSFRHGWGVSRSLLTVDCMLLILCCSVKRTRKQLYTTLKSLQISMTLMHKTISVTATIMAMVSRRICLWLQSIIEKQTSKAKVSWAIVGFGNRNTMQALPLENKTISQIHILLCVCV